MLMQTYNATCRPAGQITHEIPKQGLTAPEVILLRHIHGDDGVVRLTQCKGESSLSEAGELDRLKSIYGDKVVAAVFGSTHGARLPMAIPAEWLPEGSEPQDKPKASKPN